MPVSNVGDPETYAIIGAAMEVHREFGCGFLEAPYHAAMLCFESVLVEVKAVAALGPIDQAQAINYLRVSGLTRALVLNFGAASLEYRRIVAGDRPGRTVPGRRKAETRLQ